MKLLIKRRPGSSLIFVMLVVAGIVTIVFGTQRLALVQFSQSTREEDNLIAYYAAKAGIEDGLARFRFERNTETIQKNTFTAERYDLTKGENKGYVKDDTAITSTAGYRPDHQYYDLRIDFKKDKVGVPAIDKDTTLQLTGFPDQDNKDYFLHYRFEFDNGSDCFVQLQQIRTDVSNTYNYEQVVVNQIGNQKVYDSSTANLPILTGVGTTLTNQVRIRPFNCSLTNVSFQTVTARTGTAAAGITFDATQTFITATGYYGSTKRTLLATVNRQSGQLISIYDFNAFAGQGNIKP